MDDEIRSVKEAVRRRDRFRCTVCGMTNRAHLATYGRQLDVHRKAPGSNYTVRGCVTVCRKCHGPLPRAKRGNGRYLFIKPGHSVVYLTVEDRVKTEARVQAARRGIPLSEYLEGIVKEAVNGNGTQNA